jgi:hypothetical protein
MSSTSSSTLPTREERATRALRNAMSRANKHLANGKVDAARTALRHGEATAASWINGTHTKMHRASN